MRVEKTASLSRMAQPFTRSMMGSASVAVTSMLTLIAYRSSSSARLPPSSCAKQTPQSADMQAQGGYYRYLKDQMGFDPFQSSHFGEPRGR
jgi:hypothetical protein